MISFSSHTVKALTWKEPFAELMLHGKIETRKKPIKYRGWVLICAGKEVYNLSDLNDISGDFQIGRMLKLKRKIPLHLGHAIAIGWLGDCRPMVKSDENDCYVKYNPKLFCHIYTDVHPITPIAWKGKQGWKDVPYEVKEQIKFLNSNQ